MKIFLAIGGIDAKRLEGSGWFTPEKAKEFYCLSSFHYIRSSPSLQRLLVPLIPYFKGFMLDSGAFTFMQQKPTGLDFAGYLEEYIAFIQQHRVANFFELDIDSIVGYEVVLQYRQSLEKKLGRQCIPVWHKSRGREAFLRMCSEYKYVAIGGIASKEITKVEHKYFPWFIREAHKRGARIHGLGYTSLSDLNRYPFDSVDSSSWSYGNRFGRYWTFNGKSLDSHKRPVDKRIMHIGIAGHNFSQWVVFAKCKDSTCF